MAMNTPVWIGYTVQAAQCGQPSAELIQLIANLMSNYTGNMRPEDYAAVVAWFSNTYGPAKP